MCPLIIASLRQALVKVIQYIKVYHSRINPGFWKALIEQGDFPFDPEQ